MSCIKPWYLTKRLWQCIPHVTWKRADFVHLVYLHTQLWLIGLCMMHYKTDILYLLQNQQIMWIITTCSSAIATRGEEYVPPIYLSILVCQVLVILLVCILPEMNYVQSRVVGLTQTPLLLKIMSKPYIPNQNHMMWGLILLVLAG